MPYAAAASDAYSSVITAGYFRNQIDLGTDSLTSARQPGSKPSTVTVIGWTAVVDLPVFLLDIR